MKSSKIRLFLMVVIAIFAAMPAAVALAAPVNAEYGFEPTPGAATNSSSVNESEAAAAGTNQTETTSSDTSPNFFQIIGDSWVLIAVLGAMAVGLGVLTWRRYRSGGTKAGMLTRLVALAAVLVALPLISLSSAQSKPPSAPDGFFGVITQTGFTPTDATKMVQGGIETLRVPVAWSSVQPDNGKEFNWGYTDTVVSEATKAGLTVLPFLYGSPLWATGKGTRLPVHSSAQRKDWLNFVDAAVQRYGPDGDFWTEHGPDTADPVPNRPVETWQIWNEANFFFFASPISPNDYMSLLKASSDEIKSLDPEAQIMLSGLYGSPPNKQIKSGKAMVSYKYLTKLYSLGAKKYFDIAALHPYTPNTPATAALLEKFRKVMNANGDKKTPLSITEVGWGSDKKGFLNVGSPGKQAKQVKSAYNYFLANRTKLNLASVYWFVWKELPKSVVSCNFCYSTGFFKSSKGLVAKPAWKQFVKFTGGKP